MMANQSSHSPVLSIRCPHFQFFLIQCLQAYSARASEIRNQDARMHAQSRRKGKYARSRQNDWPGWAFPQNNSKTTYGYDSSLILAVHTFTGMICRLLQVSLHTTTTIQWTKGRKEINERRPSPLAVIS